MSNRFKSSLFSGFNRRDVVSYITGQAKEKEALSDRTAELEAQVEELRTALSEAHEENQALQSELSEARQRAEQAEETCRGLQQAVRSSLTELNALSGVFERREEAEVPDLPADDDGNVVPEKAPTFAEEEPSAEPEPSEGCDCAPEAEEPGAETPVDGSSAEPSDSPAAPSAEEPTPKRRTVEIRRHERI